MDYDLLADHELVNGILNNNKPLIKYFFTKKCYGLIVYILMKVFDGNIDKRGLACEFYQLLAHNDCQIIRKFQFRSTLMTYVSVVSVRFFINKRSLLIDSTSSSPLHNKDGLFFSTVLSSEQRIDIREALKKIPNERYRKVTEILDMQDVHKKISRRNERDSREFV